MVMLLGLRAHGGGFCGSGGPPVVAGFLRHGRGVACVGRNVIGLRRGGALLPCFRGADRDGRFMERFRLHFRRGKSGRECAGFGMLFGGMHCFFRHAGQCSSLGRGQGRQLALALRGLIGRFHDHLQGEGADLLLGHRIGRGEPLHQRHGGFFQAVTQMRVQRGLEGGTFGIHAAAFGDEDVHVVVVAHAVIVGIHPDIEVIRPFGKLNRVVLMGHGCLLNCISLKHSVRGSS
ncbi:MAG: hypothetical protein DI582_05520 [Azospirillum brasilense]|nr:MAG: hypothetical protein DI582_05520 [Azospirillum brasilense]